MKNSGAFRESFQPQRNERNEARRKFPAYSLYRVSKKSKFVFERKIFFVCSHGIEREEKKCEVENAFMLLFLGGEASLDCAASELVFEYIDDDERAALSMFVNSQAKSFSVPSEEQTNLQLDSVEAFVEITEFLLIISNLNSPRR
jgi:hypothetical protein